jgi:hypothetical protein
MAQAIITSLICYAGMVLAVRWIYQTAKSRFGIFDLAIKSLAATVLVFVLGRLIIACYPASSDDAPSGRFIAASIYAPVAGIGGILLFQIMRLVRGAFRRITKNGRE